MDELKEVCNEEISTEKKVEKKTDYPIRVSVYQKEVNFYIGKAKQVDQRLIEHRAKTAFENGQLKGKVTYENFFKVISVDFEKASCVIETDYPETLNEIKFVTFDVSEKLLAGLAILEDGFKLNAGYRTIPKTEAVEQTKWEEVEKEPYVETRSIIDTIEVPIFITEQHLSKELKWEFLATLPAELSIKGLFEGENCRPSQFKNLEKADFVVSKINLDTKTATLELYEIPNIPPDMMLLTFVWMFNNMHHTSTPESVSYIVAANTIDATPWNQHKAKYAEQQAILATL